MLGQIHTYIKNKVKDYELYYTHTDTTSFLLQRENIDFATEGSDDALGVRVFLDGKMGFASTMHLSQYQACVDQAIKIARLNNHDPKFKQFVGPQKIPKVPMKTKILADLPYSALQKTITDYIKSLKSVHKDVRISSGGYERNISTIHLINSAGVNLQTAVAANSLSAEILYKDQALSFGTEERIPLDPDQGKEHAQRLVAMDHAQKIPTQTLPLVLHPDALASLMEEAFTFAIDAEHVQQKKSYFTGKIGKPIFDPKITITDDALDPKRYMSRPFDDEGTPSQKTALVTKGKLTSYSYDSYTAYDEQKKSTGNAHRNALSTPSIGPNNTLLEQGTKKINDLISSLKKGVYVTQLLGTHTMNENTGDFSLAIYEGQYIQDGVIKHALKDTMIAGNFFALLKDVQAISKEVKHAGRGYYIPYTLFPSINVIGE